MLKSSRSQGQDHNQGDKGIVKDGIEMKRYDWVGDPVFSKTGEMAYIARRGDKEIIVKGEKESKEYSSVSSITFSQDSGRIAFVASDEAMQDFVVVDAMELREYSYATFLNISRDGKMYSYLSRKEDGSWLLIVNGKAEARFEHYGAGEIIISWPEYGNISLNLVE